MLSQNVTLDKDSVVSEAEARFFRDEGFLIPNKSLDPQTTTELCTAVEAVLHDNPGIGEVTPHFFIPQRPGRSDGLQGGEKLFRFALHPTVLSVARALLGPNLILWGGEILFMRPGAGKGSPWHQDCMVSFLRAGSNRAEPRGANIWIAVDDVNRENSCMRFVPDSARRGRIASTVRTDPNNPNAFPTFSIDRTGLRLEDAVDSILARGHFSVHDLFAVHGANPNTSERRRVAITFRYLDANDAFDRNFRASGDEAYTSHTDRPLWLVLGENKNPLNDLLTGHDGLEDLDALAEKTRLRLG